MIALIQLQLDVYITGCEDKPNPLFTKIPLLCNTQPSVIQTVNHVQRVKLDLKVRWLYGKPLSSLFEISTFSKESAWLLILKVLYQICCLYSHCMVKSIHFNLFNYLCLLLLQDKKCHVALCDSCKYCGAPQKCIQTQNLTIRRNFQIASKPRYTATKSSFYETFIPTFLFQYDVNYWNEHFTSCLVRYITKNNDTHLNDFCIAR